MSAPDGPLGDTEKSGPPPDYTAGPPAYGQPVAPQPQYGQPVAPQPQYGQPVAPQPQYGQPPAQQQPPVMQPKLPEAAAPYGQPSVQYIPPAQPMGQSSTVIINQPGNIQLGFNNFGPSPTTMTCQYCSASVTTMTHTECGAAVWVYCGVICLIGLIIPLVWLGCCLIPFCIPSLYNTRHNCPNCMRQVGMYRGGGM